MSISGIDRKERVDDECGRQKDRDMESGTADAPRANARHCTAAAVDIRHAARRMRKRSGAASMSGPPIMRTLLLVRLVPLGEPVLGLLGRLFGLHRAVEHLGADVPQLVFEVRRAARQDLVGVADRALAGAAPARRTSPPPDPSTSTLALDSGKKPGSELAKISANSSEATQSRKALAASALCDLAFMPMPISVWSVM